MANKPNGTLYIGVTSDLSKRIWEHRSGACDGFTKRHSVTRLVYAERHEDILSAIAREKAMKHWRRAWKVRLIQSGNPDWADLYNQIA